MTPEGLAAMDQLAAAIVELERSIPKEIDWALQVDGHTDVRPIASPQFPSNWELSTARAISVVKLPRSPAASAATGWSRPATASSSRSRTATPRTPSAATAASS